MEVRQRMVKEGCEANESAMSASSTSMLRNTTWPWRAFYEKQGQGRSEQGVSGRGEYLKGYGRTIGSHFSQGKKISCDTHSTHRITLKLNLNLFQSNYVINNNKYSEFNKIQILAVNGIEYSKWYLLVLTRLRFTFTLLIQTQHLIYILILNSLLPPPIKVNFQLKFNFHSANNF